jgi:hypothetical protein
LTGPGTVREDGPEAVPPSFPPAARARTGEQATVAAASAVEPALHPDDARPDDATATPRATATTDESAPATETAAAHHLDRPRRRRGATVAIVLLSVALVAALAGGGYLGLLSHQWNERSGEWEAQSRELGQRVADLTTDLEGITGDLTSTRDQLTTAQQRITELADEKAQVGDDRENQRIAVSDFQAVAEAAVDVSSKMGDCVTAQSALLGFLSAPDSTTPEGLQQATDDTNSICTVAIDSYTALQRDLSQP